MIAQDPVKGTLKAGDTLMVNEEFRNSRFDAFIQMQRDGNLVVAKGTPGKREGILWASGIVDSAYDKSYTTLQEDGNLITWENMGGSTPIWMS